ncbi:MAG: hypothetical protein MJA27_24020 [Pseudanabaenales cyanobacterium]|nr:hypothetical protein [Pseudanabaenales cyanobacterium]
MLLKSKQSNTIVTDSQMSESRLMIALINPKSGQGKARRDLNVVLPIFEKSNIHLRVAEIQGSQIVCQGVRQSFLNFFQSLDLATIHGIIVGGGDGTVHSTVNALMSRADWTQAIKIPIGFLPSGTDNGLCKTVLELSGEPYSLKHAALLIAQGRLRSLDIFKIHQEKRTFYGVHSLAWGLVSDIDIESNHLRFLGPFKEWIYGLAYVLRRRFYAGTLLFDPQFSLQAKSPILSNKQTDTFIGIWAVNVPWAGRDRLSTPFAKLDDGLIDLLVLRQGISRRHLLELFIKTEDGSHIHCPKLEYYKTQALALNPISIPGTIAIDGEAVDYGPISIEVLQKLCTIFCR